MNSKVTEISPGFFLDLEYLAVKFGDESINLTSTEYEILKILLDNRGKPVPYSRFAQTIWKEIKNKENAIRIQISKLRGKHPVFKSNIRAIRGKGYLLS